MDRAPQSERLREEYRGAFNDWALQVNRLREIGETNPNSVVEQEAGERVAAAEAAYRTTRDRLTDEMTVDAEKP